jgi:methylenetetrahydrofolate reductase (NADPH)
LKTFRDTLNKKDFVVTATLPLKPSSNASHIEDAATILAPCVDAIQVADDRYAVGHMSVLVAASIVMRRGVDAIVHISCRDRNRIGLLAELLGAAALDVTTLFLGRGEKFSKTAPMRSKGVFEVDATQLTALARHVGSDSSLVSNPGFCLGSFVTVFDPAEDWAAERVREKLNTGIRLLQTRPCLNAKLLRRYMQKIVEQKITHQASIIVDVPLLTSLAEAQALKENFKGAPIPDNALQRIESSNDPVREGVSVCAEMIAEVRTIPGVSGVNIQHWGAPANVVAAIRLANGE